MTHELSVSFHGAARSTTGSRHLVNVDGARVLLDCGLYQGRRKNTYERNLNFGFDVAGVDAVILSHAHIDHSGNLPNLVKQGFDGPIHSTAATADLCGFLLRDSAYIQEKDARWLNRRRSKRRKANKNRNAGDDVVEPLYTSDDAERCLTQFQSVDYHRPLRVFPGLEASFIDAGHILGSASPILDVRVGEDAKRLAFSGDLGRAGLPMLRDPEIPQNVDWLIMEGTYGARDHDPIGDAKEELRSAVERVAGRGGKIIVPSFSVERTQEIVYYLNELYNEGALLPIPIYVDSPLAVNVTEVFRKHPECFDKKTHELLLHDPDPLGFERLKYVRDVQESKDLNNSTFPCMVISASGMCEAGRILHHLRNSIEDSRNCIVFVGYQAQGTLGRKIVERKREVNIFGEPHTVRAEVVTLNTFSGHADRRDLFEYARSVRDASPALKRVYLVHGEQTGLETLAARLREELSLDVVIPELDTTHDLPLD